MFGQPANSLKSIITDWKSLLLIAVVIAGWIYIVPANKIVAYANSFIFLLLLVGTLVSVRNYRAYTFILIAGLAILTADPLMRGYRIELLHWLQGTVRMDTGAADNGLAWLLRRTRPTGVLLSITGLMILNRRMMGASDIPFQTVSFLSAQKLAMLQRGAGILIYLTVFPGVAALFLGNFIPTETAQVIAMAVAVAVGLLAATAMVVLQTERGIQYQQAVMRNRRIMGWLLGHKPTRFLVGFGIFAWLGYVSALVGLPWMYTAYFGDVSSVELPVAGWTHARYSFCQRPNFKTSFLASSGVCLDPHIPWVNNGKEILVRIQGPTTALGTNVETIQYVRDL